MRSSIAATTSSCPRSKNVPCKVEKLKGFTLGEGHERAGSAVQCTSSPRLAARTHADLTRPAAPLYLAGADV